MEKIQPKTHRLITLVLCIVLFGMAVFSMYFYSSRLNAQQQLDTLKTEIESATLKQQTVHEELVKQQAIVEEFMNLDEKLISIKEEYFEHAVQADLLARSGEANFKVAYLTFDDGPYMLTNDFLDVLEKYDVQATFFLRKRTNSAFDSIYTRYISGCHTIGNHTANHNIFGSTYSSESQFMNELISNRDFIYEKLGYTTDVMRFPGGSGQLRYTRLNRASVLSQVSNAHYAYVDWTISCGDGGASLTPEGYYNNVVKYTPYTNVAVILMHDYSSNTLAMLPMLIEELRAEGYIFLPLSYNSPAVTR